MSYVCNDCVVMNLYPCEATEFGRASCPLLCKALLYFANHNILGNVSCSNGVRSRDKTQNVWSLHADKRKEQSWAVYFLQISVYI